MTDQLDNTTYNVIPQNDPTLPPHLDFQVLRREGLLHIGNLSGKIWTDHNVHDPGITILEAVCYALLDLGYRVQLPFRDLIARKNPETETDDNFLTPLQALTVNPVTITDYRKLLLEIACVRNAWLEPAAHQEVKLWVDMDVEALSLSEPRVDKGGSTACKDDLIIKETTDHGTVISSPGPHLQINLNGLYHVLIEKEAWASDDHVRDAVRILLSAHRNLCEDFMDITILCPAPIGICAEIDLHPDAQAEKVYAVLLEKLSGFIQPVPQMYSLEALLDKGKAIEDVFAGRPRLDSSFGFIDTEEIEHLPRRKEIHLSDLYNLILATDGVNTVRRLKIDGGLPLQPAGSSWQEGVQIPDKFVPVFSLDGTCIDFRKNAGIINFDKEKVHKTLGVKKKARLSGDLLDWSLLEGQFRPDLADYFSIQHDFPNVYGIGEDGLPDSASLERKTQALQLKGYLLFYDQLLADYLAQLSNIRPLFSMKRETERTPREKRTYFSQVPDSVPGLDRLVRFYDRLAGGAAAVVAQAVFNNADLEKALKLLSTNSRTELTIRNDVCGEPKGLVEHYIHSSAVLRSAYIHQLSETFASGRYSIEILQDKYGCFFILRPETQTDLVFIGSQRFTSAIEAREAAEQAAFLAALADNFILTTREGAGPGGQDAHLFDLSYSPVAYLRFLQEMVEDETLYTQRRKAFLDHLLGRFAEQFNDYALFRYQTKVSEQENRKQVVEKESLFLSEYEDVGRNRGKAFNYFAPSWNTENVSGFEKRVSLLAGIQQWRRRNLCNFEVSECLQFKLKDHQGQLLFTGKSDDQTRQELETRAGEILHEIQKPASYPALEKELDGFQTQSVRRLFSHSAAEENLVVSRYHYRLELTDARNQTVRVSTDTKIPDQSKAVALIPEFVKTINKQPIPKGQSANNKLQLLRLNEVAKEYLDVAALPLDIKPIITWKWHIVSKGRQERSSEKTFDNAAEAWSELAETTAAKRYITPVKAAWRWKLSAHDLDLHWKSTQWFPENTRALIAFRAAKAASLNKSNYVIHEAKDASVFWLELYDEKNTRIAATDPISKTENTKTEVFLDISSKLLQNKNAKPDYEQSDRFYHFVIPDEKGMVILNSYQAYESPAAAAIQLGEVFKTGVKKERYFLTGDEANPDYNFLIKNADGLFIASPEGSFETLPERNAAMTRVMKQLSAASAPLQVLEEPRRYTWSLELENAPVLSASTEFNSDKAARTDFERTIVKEAGKEGNTVFAPYKYLVHVLSAPARYRHIYLVTGVDSKPLPLFQSYEEYPTPNTASEAYSGFMQALPGLNLVSNPELEDPKYEFALFTGSSRPRPVAVQYFDESGQGAGFAAAQTLVYYIQSIYTPQNVIQDVFVQENMLNPDGQLYQWRFLKKNEPVAVSPRTCPGQSDAQDLLKAICGLPPSVGPEDCPKLPHIICPAKDPLYYHYVVQFRTIDGKLFQLYSYAGYETEAEAEQAYRDKWFSMIQLAENPNQYGKSIGLTEGYASSKSECEGSSFLAVIPEYLKSKLNFSNDEDLVAYFAGLASLFPVFEVLPSGSNKEDDCFRFRMVSEIPLPAGTCFVDDEKDRYIWESTDCFETPEIALEAYYTFLPISQNPKSCRIFCRQGNFYVGLVEILAESNCSYHSEEEAWDETDPRQVDPCGACSFGGVRAFTEAAEDTSNIIPYKENGFWRFKVVAPSYFVVKHRCTYDSKALRDQAYATWLNKLKDVDWADYFPDVKEVKADGSASFYLELELGVDARIRSTSAFTRTRGGRKDRSQEWLCALMDQVRVFQNQCDPIMMVVDWATKFNQLNATLKGIGQMEVKGDEKSVIAAFARLNRIAAFYPVFQTEAGFCFRFYWEQTNVEPLGDGPCGCDPVDAPSDSGIVDACPNPFPFESARCFACCEGAEAAFMEFCEFIRKGMIGFWPTAETESGPYSFTLTDEEKVLATHPQRYATRTELQTAIEHTKICLDNEGMHLLEHILLRPRTAQDGSYVEVNDGVDVVHNCLLPICADYCCDIDWKPDFDPDDPCAVSDPPVIHYLPGADPYSFWATVVMPGWTKRFRQSINRRFFEDMLYREAPALVGLNILWLSPRDMCKFEDSYRLWLEWLECPVPQGTPGCFPNNQPAQCGLVECIKSLEIDAPCDPPEDAAQSCACNKVAEPVNSNTCCPLNDVPAGSIFWADCAKELADKHTSNKVSAAITMAPAPVQVQVPPASAGARKTQYPPKSEKQKPRRSEKAAVLTPVIPPQTGTSNLQERKEKYFAEVMNIKSKTIKQSPAYSLIAGFLGNPAGCSFTGFMQLSKTICDNYLKSNSKDNKAWQLPLQNVLRCLFDRIALDMERMSKKDWERLDGRLANFDEKGIHRSAVAQIWKPGEIEPQPDRELVDQILNILNKT